MKTFSVEDIMDLGPCEDYAEERVSQLWNGKESLSLEEINKLDIDIDDRLWVLARLVPTETAVNWAQYCANEAQYCAKDSNANSYVIRFADLSLWHADRATKAYKGAYYSKSATEWTIYHVTQAAEYAADSARHAGSYCAASNVEGASDLKKRVEKLVEKLIEMNNELKKD